MKMRVGFGSNYGICGKNIAKTHKMPPSHFFFFFFEMKKAKKQRFRVLAAYTQNSQFPLLITSDLYSCRGTLDGTAVFQSFMTLGYHQEPKLHRRFWRWKVSHMVGAHQVVNLCV